MDLNKKHMMIMKWLTKVAEIIKSLAYKDFNIQEKSSWKDLVTDVDIQVEKFFVQQINQHYPEDLILGEESFNQQSFSDESALNQKAVWVIDPIDGTLNFIHKKRDYAVMLSYYQEGVGHLAYIMDMNTGDIYHVQRGRGLFKNNMPFQLPNQDLALEDAFIAFNSTILHQQKYGSVRSLAKHSRGARMIGSAGQETLSLIKSETSAYLSSSLMPWDFASATLFFQECGIKYSNLNGEGLHFTKKDSIIFAYPKAFNQIHEHLMKSRP